MGPRFERASRRGALLLAAIFALALTARAQLPAGIVVKANPQIPLYRDTAHGQIIDAMITFQGASSAGKQALLVQQFDMRTFKDGDTNLVQMKALAPQCTMNLSTKIASDPGPLEIFTPTTNLYIQGTGFYCDQSRRLLIISNQVETRIVKGLLKAPLFGAATSPTNAGQVVRILADYCHFDSFSNVIDYIGNVRVFDPQGDSSSRTLTIYLTTNNAVRGFLASDDVIVNVTNRGRATGRSALYMVTNRAERVTLSGEAVWRNGAEEARAELFIYDSAAHTLDATNHVRVRWPNPTTSSNTFAELFADTAVLQWPATNGPIEGMTAEGNVVLINQADLIRATGQRAVYGRARDLFELTGAPVWWNDQTEVRGEVLSVGLSNRVYRADGKALLTTRDAGSTNRSTQIACDHLNFQTNLAEFHDNVTARSYVQGALQNTLTCRLLTATLVSNKIQTAIARGDVRGESEPDATGARKTMRCETLTARRSDLTGWLEKVVGEKDVVIEEFGGAKPGYDSLHADLVTATFSTQTNRLEQAVAERNVALEQRKGAQTMRASSERAVYVAGTNEQMTLTGHPLAQTDKYSVDGSDALVWSAQGNGFRAVGRYKIIPIPPAKAP